MSYQWSRDPRTSNSSRNHGQYGYNHNSYSARRMYEADSYQPTNNYASGNRDGMSSSTKHQPRSRNNSSTGSRSSYESSKRYPSFSNGDPQNTTYTQTQHNQYSQHTVKPSEQSPVISSTHLHSHQPTPPPPPLQQTQSYPEHVELEHPAKKQKSNSPNPVHKSYPNIGPCQALHSNVDVALTRKDIQYEFLSLLFNDNTRAFSDPYQSSKTLLHNEPKELGHKLTFSELYMKSLAHSNQISKTFRSRLAQHRDVCVPPSVVCFLYNAGRLQDNTFIPKMTLKAHVTIPSLEVNYDPPVDLEPKYHIKGRKQLMHDTATINSLLKGNISRTKEPKKFKDLEKITKKPRTTIINLLFMFKDHETDINNLFFNEAPYKYADIFMNECLNPFERANLLLWLVFAYLETDVSVQAQSDNPWGPVPPVLNFTSRIYDVDTPQEIHFAAKSLEIRKYCKAGKFKPLNKGLDVLHQTQERTSSVKGIKTVNHFSKEDGVPLTREDIQFEFLEFLFGNERKVFTDRVEKQTVHRGIECQEDGLTFSELYQRTIRNHSLCPKSLRQKLDSDDKFDSLPPTMVCFLVQMGIIDSQSVFVTDGSPLRIFRPIPCLQLYHKSDQRDRSGNPIITGESSSINSVLKVAASDSKVSSLEQLAKENSPRTNILNLLFLFKNFQNHLNIRCGLERLKFTFHDLLTNETIDPKARAETFLYLVFAYLENRTPNPFIFQDISLLEIKPEGYNIDTTEEIAYGQKFYHQRKMFLQKSWTDENSTETAEMDNIEKIDNLEHVNETKSTAHNFLAGVLNEIKTDESGTTENVIISEPIKEVENGSAKPNNDSQDESLNNNKEEVIEQSKAKANPVEKDGSKADKRIEMIKSLEMDTDSPHQILIKIPELVKNKTGINDILNHISNSLSNHYCIYFGDDE